MTMVLYAADSTGILAAANLRKQECSTSKSYVACRIDATDTRKSKLKVLVDDLVEGESRVYGCNVSAFVSGMRAQLYSWSITVYRISKFIRSLFNRRRGMFNHVYFMYFLLTVSPSVLDTAPTRYKGVTGITGDGNMVRFVVVIKLRFGKLCFCICLFIVLLRHFIL